MPDKNADTRPILLVPVDFSEHSRNALLWACELARCRKASIVVLHVVHDPAHSPGYYKRGKDDVMQPMEEAAAKMMRRFMKATRKKMGDKKLPAGRFTTRLVIGLPVPRILDFATQIGARQIIMGSQGLTGFKRLMLGSKAEQVVRASRIPVTIIPALKT